jgi:toxin ParE1/3/4
MARCEFTAQAIEDLREIGRYTKRTWGVAQARRYRQELELELKKLSLSPWIGLGRDDIAADVRSFTVASHIAFYRPKRNGITVLRLLHPSMDVERAFAAPAKKSQEKKETAVLHTRRLAALGGTERTLKPTRRRRSRPGRS